MALLCNSIGSDKFVLTEPRPTDVCGRGCWKDSGYLREHRDVAISSHLAGDKTDGAANRHHQDQTRDGCSFTKVQSQLVTNPVYSPWLGP